MAHQVEEYCRCLTIVRRQWRRSRRTGHWLEQWKGTCHDYEQSIPLVDQIDIRSDQNGEVIFKDSLKSSVAGIVKVSVKAQFVRRTTSTTIA